MEEHPELQALRRRAEEEEKAYAALLASLDGLADLPIPANSLPELPRQLARINEMWRAAPPPDGGGLTGRHHRSVWGVVAPALQRQEAFNSALVQLLNGYLDQTARLHARHGQVVSALVQYLQRVLPVVDARDRVASALTTTRAELVLEAFDRRQESLARRLEGLLALRDRLETVSEEVRGLRGALTGPPPPEVARQAARAADDAPYAAFENRFRGTREEIRRHLADYVKHFERQGPVLELGSGRGEFLELMKEAGIPARGVDSNARAVAESRGRGLEVAQGDLVDALRAEAEGSLGGVFAAQVAEHLPPAVLQETLREAHRALRPGGLLVLETVNPRSALGFLEVYIRDLTHERPLHPDTLSFLAGAAGFTEVRVEMRAPVDAATRLQPVPVDGLPPRVAEVLNENVARLNGFLYAPQEYALLARR
jgi:O-antigen chain-terminating methyltransferase